MGVATKVAGAPRGATGWLRKNYDDPVVWSEITQAAKTVLAAVVAWAVAAEVWHLPQPFLAPWSALLVVHTTVYRTFSQGFIQVGSAVLGVVVAWVLGNWLGLTPLTVGLVVLLGLTTRLLPKIDDAAATAIAGTATVVLCTGGSTHDVVLVTRLVDTAIGIGVGLVVNLVVWPPLRRRVAVRGLDVVDDRIGDLLREIAGTLGPRTGQEQVEQWVDRTRSIDADLEQAWSLVRQAVESARMNPRRPARGLRDPKEWRGLLRRMEQANAEVRSMVRTLGRSLELVNDWDDEFRDRYLRLLGQAGDAISRADPDPVRRVHEDLEAFIADLATWDVPSHLWPEYGGLLVNLRNIVAAMDEVAAANPLTLQRRGPRRLASG